MSNLVPNWKRSYLMAQLSSIAYLTDLNAVSQAVARLGLEYVAVIEAVGFQAVIVREADGGQIVAFRGTPVTCGRDIADTLTALADDVGIAHTDVGGGAKVLAAPLRVAKAQWARILTHLDLSKPLALTGHSLGAVMALITAALIERSVALSLIVFAPFQCANAAFWIAVFGGRAQPLVFGRANDFAPGWDHLDPVTSLTGVVCHLVAGTFEWVTRWPWYEESEPDHAVSAYVEDIGNQAEQQAA